jgi:hypothetical protein
MGDLYIFCNYEGFFFCKVSIIFNTLLPVLSKTLHTNVVKFPASALKHIIKTLFQIIHLQNDVHVVYPLQGQTGGSQRVSGVDCELDGEEQSIPFL